MNPRRVNQPRLLDVQAHSVKFDQKLVLNQWMLSLFEVDSFDQLAGLLRDASLEGFDTENITHFYRVLIAHLFQRQHLTDDLLLGYDQNIVRHWKGITQKRNLQGFVLNLKYFQYLSLLFTEIYLDRYFSNPDQLLIDLNTQIEKFNTNQIDKNQIPFYQLQELNKIAYWMATGSGKTLLMHINILQYQHYLKLHNHTRTINRIILLTPNEGLSQQHLVEFGLSGIRAEMFSKEGYSLFTGREVEIIDIHKLRDESGEKTVAVEAFEGNNLVLVDEGHRGSSGKETGEWMKKRESLCADGFSFEYSATFGQAMKASGNRSLEQIYSHCILFDYSYKYFYKDGYGKEYRILNLEDDTEETQRRRYLVACLLAFYQQQKLFADKGSIYRPFLLEKPLWIFVGSSVNAVRIKDNRKVSDVVDILLFLASVVNPARQRENIQIIDAFLKGNSGLLDIQGNDLFASSFKYLVKSGLSAEKIFADLLRVLFNTESPAALHVINLKGTDGEIALKIGDHEEFGLINVGDPAALCKLCEDQSELVVEDQEFSGSIFHSLEKADSPINILIGSKKFMEGWNSWRVSTMGLMNVGRSEGSEIIQLFGRGVRLKGKDFCLKRSRKIAGVSAPPDLETLETLNIFGVRADYMRQFKEYLENEGVPSNEDKVELVLPVIKFDEIEKLKLKIVRVKEGIDFKRMGPRPDLDLLDEPHSRQKVNLNWYPKIQAMASEHGQGLLHEAYLNQGYLSEAHTAFMDMNQIYYEMQHFKNERAWFNLNLSVEKIDALLKRHDWYELYIPPEELEFHLFNQVYRWQEIALVLLKKYCDYFYHFKKSAYEKDFLEYSELTPDNPNLVKDYHLWVERSQQDIISKIQEIKELIDTRQMRDIEYQGLLSIMFNRHLYQPLICVNGSTIEVKPVKLNEGERSFVLDLRSYYENNPGVFKDKELYLLRNLSRGKGIGFFEAGNFYPDFIMWIVANGKQEILFIDPKGLIYIEGVNDPKLQFYKKIKDTEQQLNDPGVHLHSVIISNTPFQQIAWWGHGQEDIEKMNVLFRTDDLNYISKLLSIVSNG